MYIVQLSKCIKQHDKEAVLHNMNVQENKYYNLQHTHIKLLLPHPGGP